jgi:hypothetical protein
MSREQKIRRQLAIRRQLTSVLDVSSRRFVLWRPPGDPEITTLPCEQLCDGQHQECTETLGRRLQGSHRIRHTDNSTKIAPSKTHCRPRELKVGGCYLAWNVFTMVV